MTKKSVKIPDYVSSRWIATLANDQLIAAESVLHADFFKRETAEKQRRGSRYEMLHGPTALVNAWLRWLLVNNETRSRGLLVTHRR